MAVHVLPLALRPDRQRALPRQAVYGSLLEFFHVHRALPPELADLSAATYKSTMAPSTALTTKPEAGSLYQLDISQITRAAESLVKHIAAEQKRKEAESGKKSLLPAPGDDSDDEATEQDEVPIWLILTTKKHITDTKRLKPGKMCAESLRPDATTPD